MKTFGMFGALVRLMMPQLMEVDGGEGGGGDPPAGKTFTQAELDRIVTERVQRVTEKFAGVDTEEYRKLKEADEKRTEEELKRKGEFEKILSETAKKKDEEIARLAGELASERIDGTLEREAAGLRAVNARQVMQLLKGQVRVNEGALEVLDAEGKARYEGSNRVSPKQLVEEFLKANPHFVVAGGSGSGAGGGDTMGGGGKGRKLADLDFSKAEDRKYYEEHFMDA
jgi:hypothetical protein